MNVKEMKEFLSQFDDDVDLCVVTKDYDEMYLDIHSCETDDYEGNIFIVIRAFPL